MLPEMELAVKHRTLQAAEWTKRECCEPEEWING